VAGWIFDHSKKTSRKSCLELAALVKPYKHWVLILSIVQAESEFVPSAVSSKLAQGLGQVSFSAHGKDLIAKGIIKEQRDLFDPEMNIRAANHIIEMYMKQHGGDVIKALSAYVGAPEQHKYLAQVLTNYIRLSLALV
jgi:soluble lytic murein transglycosylase-like protein